MNEIEPLGFNLFTSIKKKQYSAVSTLANCTLRICLSGGGVPQVGKDTLLGGVTLLSVYLVKSN